MRYLVFDTETSGLPNNPKDPASASDNWPRLVQIAWIVFDDSGRRLEKACFIINSRDLQIPEEVSKIHHISTNLMRQMGSNLYGVLALFQDAVRKVDKVIAHNVNFDYNVVESEFLRLGLKSGIKPEHLICTMAASKSLVQLPPTQRQQELLASHYVYNMLVKYSAKVDGVPIPIIEDTVTGEFQYKAPKLHEMYKFLFGTDLTNLHDGLADAEACAECFFELRKREVIQVNG